MMDFLEGPHSRFFTRFKHPVYLRQILSRGNINNDKAVIRVFVGGSHR